MAPPHRMGDRLVENGSAIELRGTLNQGELARFQYFHVLRRIWLPVLVCALCFVLAFQLTRFVAIDGPGMWTTHELIVAVLFLLPLSALAFVVVVMPYWRAKRQIDVQTFLRDPLIYVFTTEAISTAGTGVSSSITWRLLKWVRVRETRSLFLLYYAANQALIIPKRLFQTPDEMERWRQMDRIVRGT